MLREKKDREFMVIPFCIHGNLRWSIGRGKGGQGLGACGSVEVSLDLYVGGGLEWKAWWGGVGVGETGEGRNVEGEGVAWNDWVKIFLGLAEGMLGIRKYVAGYVHFRYSGWCGGVGMWLISGVVDGYGGWK